MGKDAAVDLRVRSIIAAALRGALTEELALRAYTQRRDVGGQPSHRRAGPRFAGATTGSTGP